MAYGIQPYAIFYLIVILFYLTTFTSVSSNEYAEFVNHLFVMKFLGLKRT